MRKLNKDTEERLKQQHATEKTMLANEIEGRVRREEADKFSRMGLLNKRELDAAHEKKLTDLKRREREVL